MRRIMRQSKDGTVPGDSVESGTALGHFRADAPDTGLNGHCELEIMPRQHVIEDRKMPFDMNALRKISIRQERQGKKPAIPVKSRRNQQGLTFAGVDLDVPRLKEIGQFLPSRCGKSEIDRASIRKTE